MPERHFLALALVLSCSDVADALGGYLAVLVGVLRPDNIDNFEDALAARARLHHVELGHLTSHEFLASLQILLRELDLARAQIVLRVVIDR